MQHTAKYLSGLSKTSIYRAPRFAALQRSLLPYSSITLWRATASPMMSIGMMGVTPMRGFAYHQRVIDHYENPRNVGSLDKKADDVGTGLVGAPACGDVMKLQIKVNEENGKIEKAVFKTFGCGSAIASSSYATEMLTGMDIEDAVKIKN